MDEVHVPEDCYKEQPASLTGILKSQWLQTYLGIVPLVKRLWMDWLWKFAYSDGLRTSWTLAKPLASPNGIFTVQLHVSLKVPFISFRLAEEQHPGGLMLQCRETLTPRDLPSIANIEEMLACDKIDKLWKQRKGWKGALPLRYSSILTPFIMCSFFALF